MHGGRESRRRLADSWLEANPFVWLAARDRQPATLGWLVVGGLVLVWLLGWTAWPARWPNVSNFLITATVLNSVLAWLSRHTAAEQLGWARRDGAFELLLTTPLNPSEIVWGALEALRWHFRGLANFVLLLNALMMLVGLTARGWNGRALVVYFCIWLFLLTWSWSLGRRRAGVAPVMWASLNCGRPAYAVWRTSGFSSFSWIGILAWIWILCNLPGLTPGLRRFPTGSLGEMVFVLFYVVLWVISWLGRLVSVGSVNVRELKWDPEAKVWLSRRGFMRDTPGICERRLIDEFREIIREPLPDSSDPRFKTWDVRQRFPVAGEDGRRL
jgi:hypothetical protein